MATCSVTYSFANLTNADATQVNANFTSLVNFINSEVIHRDGAIAFTTIPTLPGTNPTTANQATRKAYVDSYFPLATGNIADAAVTAIKLATDSVTADKIAAGAVGTSELADGSVTSGKILDGTIATGDLADGAVTSAKILDGTIVNGDLASAKFTNIKGIQASDYCFRAYRSTSGALASGSNTLISFDTEAFDYSSLFNTTNGHWTAPAAGVYHFETTVAFESGSSVGYRNVEIRRYNSGGTLQEYVAQNSVPAGDVLGDQTVVNAAGSCLCAAGDIVRVHVLQNSGASLDIVATATQLSAFSGHCVRLT